MASPIILEHPVSRGVVTNWDDMEELWRQGIEEEMGLDAVEHPILMADSSRTTREERFIIFFPKYRLLRVSFPGRIFQLKEAFCMLDFFFLFILSLFCYTLYIYII